MVGVERHVAAHKNCKRIEREPELIVSVGEAIRNHLEGCVAAAVAKYSAAIHPIYRADRNGRPTLFGTCFGLELNGRKYLVTAAHVVDDIAADGGYIPSRGTLVPLLGDFYCTSAPSGKRADDHFDFAWKELGSDDFTQLGWSTYFSSTDFCENKDSSEGRVYLIVGYPRSKNKKANPTTRQVRPKRHAYYSTGKLRPGWLGLSGNDHIVIEQEGRSAGGDGVEVNTVHLRGLSGGPVLDLGRQSSMSDLASTAPYAGRLAGIFIEGHEDVELLLSTKLDSLLTMLRDAPRGTTVQSMTPPNSAAVG